MPSQKPLRKILAVRYMILDSNGNPLDETFEKACKYQSDMLTNEPINYKHRLASLMLSEPVSPLPDSVHICDLINKTFFPLDESLAKQHKLLRQQHHAQRQQKIY